MSRGGTKLFVGNLSYNATQDELTDAFSQFGQVTDCFFPTDRETGRMRGFAFVTLESGADDAVKKMDNADFMGRNLKVNVAEGKRDGGGGGGGFGGGRGGGGGGGYGGGGGGDYGGGGITGGGGDFGGAGDTGDGGRGRGRGRGRGGGGY